MYVRRKLCFGLFFNYESNTRSLQKTLLTANFYSRKCLPRPILTSLQSYDFLKINNILKLILLASTVSKPKIHRTCPDCPAPTSTDLSSDEVLEAATESLAKYNNESTSKQYSLFKVTRASSQVRLNCSSQLHSVSHNCCCRFLSWEENVKALILIRTKIHFSAFPTLIDLMPTLSRFSF